MSTRRGSSGAPFSSQSLSKRVSVRARFAARLALRLSASRRLHFLLMALMMTSFSFLLRSQGWFGTAILDSISLDGYFKLRGAVSARQISEKMPESRDIVLVETTHQLPRPLMAQLLRQLREARVVAFDMMFVDEAQLLKPDDLTPEQTAQWYGTSLQYWRRSDETLAKAIRENGNVVLGLWPDEKRDRPPLSSTPDGKKTDAIFEKNTIASGYLATTTTSSTRTVDLTSENLELPDEEFLWRRPAPVLWDAARSHAHLLVAPDETDNVVRAVHLYDGPRNARQPTLGLALAAAALGVSSRTLQQEIARMKPEGGVLALENRRIPYGRDGVIPIDYAGGRASFDGNRIAYNRVLDEDYSVPEDFKDKIVIIGEASQTSKEILKTPFGLMPGMQIHASVVSTLLSTRTPLRPVAVWLVVALSILSGLFLLTPLLRFSLWTTLAFGVIEFALLFWLGAAIFVNFRQILPLSVPFLTVFFTGIALWFYEHKRVRTTLGAFIGVEMLPRTLSLFSQLRLGGKTEEATAWFCDLRGYSLMSERLEAQSVSDLLAQYTDVIVRCVRLHGGRPIDYQGDGVFVLFEKTRSGSNFSKRAVLAAFETARAFDELNVERLKNDEAPFEFAIGMATGSLMIGVIGAAKNMKMGAVGDAVNVAARVQGLSRVCGFRILMARSTHDRVLDLFPSVHCGFHEVHGRTKPIEIYGLGEKFPMSALENNPKANTKVNHETGEALPS